MRWVMLGLCLAWPAQAEVLVAARMIRATGVIGPGDVAVVPGQVPGGLTDPAEVIGLEARVMLYPGRPIRPQDVGPPSVVERNQLVQITYAAGPLQIRAEGRALMRGAVGDVIRVMNLGSRTTVTGRITGEGQVDVAMSVQGF